MKRIVYCLLSGLLIFSTSCNKIDNYDGPNASLKGNIIDSTTGENLVMGPNEFNVRLWEMSWSDMPTYQDLAIQQDGFYQNTKLFQGTYDMQAYGGPFWPTDKVTNIKIGSSTTQNFTVTPYLKLIDVKATLDGVNLTLSCKLQAPIVKDLPNVREIRPFVSLTPYVGNGNRIAEYYKDAYLVSLNKAWSEIGDMTTGISNQTFTLPVLPLKSGRTFYVRIGARVKDTFEKYNYSEVIEVKVP